MLERDIQALIRQSLDKVEQLNLPKGQFEVIRHIVIRLAFTAAIAGQNSLAKDG